MTGYCCEQSNKQMARPFTDDACSSTQRSQSDSESKNLSIVFSGQSKPKVAISKSTQNDHRERHTKLDWTVNRRGGKNAGQLVLRPANAMRLKSIAPSRAARVSSKLPEVKRKKRLRSISQTERPTLQLNLSSFPLEQGKRRRRRRRAAHNLTDVCQSAIETSQAFAPIKNTLKRISTEPSALSSLSTSHAPIENPHTRVSIRRKKSNTRNEEDRHLPGHQARSLFGVVKPAKVLQLQATKPDDSNEPKPKKRRRKRTQRVATAIPRLVSNIESQSQSVSAKSDDTICRSDMKPRQQTMMTSYCQFTDQPLRGPETSRLAVAHSSKVILSRPDKVHINPKGTFQSKSGTIHATSSRASSLLKIDRVGQDSLKLVLDQGHAMHLHLIGEDKNSPESSLTRRHSELPIKSQSCCIRASKFVAVIRLLTGVKRQHTAPTPIKGRNPARRAPVWAQSRQELCEALPYYRAFQSGLYMSRRVAYGYLLDGFPAPRDEWANDGRVIISHGGGQAIRTFDKNGRPIASLSADHSIADARIDTLLQAASRKTPLVLIVGEGYNLLPWRLESAYAVLGWYWVSAAWFEAEPCARGITPPTDRDWFKRLKVRFDWVDSQGSPWWLEEPCSSSATSVFATASKDEGQSLDIVNGREEPSFSVPARTFHSILKQPPAPKIQSMLNPDDTKSVSLRSPADEQFCEVECHQEIRDLQLQLWSDTGISPTPLPATGQSLNRRGGAGCIPGSHLLVNVHDIHQLSKVSLEYSSHKASTCPTCRVASPRIYAEGWICLNHDCPQFWMLETPIGILPIPVGMGLAYDLGFLNHVTTPLEANCLPYSIVPPLPFGVRCTQVYDSDGDTDRAGTRTLWRGWVCTACGRANCRYRWEVCECRGCGLLLAHLTSDDVVPATALQPYGDTAVFWETIIKSSDIPVCFRRLGDPGATVIMYTLPSAGQIYHVKHDNLAQANAIWEAYQLAAIHTSAPLFERRPLKANAVKGQLLSQQFTINSGASYKFNVETLSYPFEESPDCVIEALKLIQDRVTTVVGTPVAFNEILSVLYREGQKMSWHDDGEKGLGPVVAALSLGSPATMSFRPKTPRKGLATYYGTKRKGSTHPIALNLRLTHGDVVIMSGREIQHKWEHKVVPLGLRAAATARSIGMQKEFV